MLYPYPPLVFIWRMRLFKLQLASNWVSHCVSKCVQCHAEVDQFGTHGLKCHFSNGCHARHAAVNDIIKGHLTQ